MRPSPGCVLEKRSYPPAVNELAAMIAKVPQPPHGETSYSAEAVYLFRWAGQLREFVAGVSELSRPLNEALAVWTRPSPLMVRGQ